MGENKEWMLKEGDWSIQAPEPEQAAFLLYKGVMVGRLYAGAPWTVMMDKLNAGEDDA